MKKTLAITAVAVLSLCAVSLVACGGGSDNNNPPPATKTTYSGTLYMASQGGGHVAVVPVTIDPSNTTTPFTLGSITRIQLSSGTGASNHTHIFHDVRLDGTKLYYSAIFTDTTGSNNGKTHLGYVDLASGNAVHDAMIDSTAQATAGMVYCGSGQSATHFFPMTMSSPAYIDAIKKSAIVTSASLTGGSADVTRTTVDSFRTNNDPNYLFAHGVNNPDSSKLFVAVNETSGGAMTGAITGYLMNTSDVVAGTVSASNVTKNTISGLTPAMGTIAFRSTFTPDGTKILQSGKDRVLVLNAANLSVISNQATIGGSYAAHTANGGVENHDAMPTPDGKYAILSLRFQHTNSAQQDSGLQLYDIANNKTIGDPVSTCSGCHDSATVAHLTCGVDGKLTAVTQ